MNDLYNNIYGRKSIRKFDANSLSKQTLEDILRFYSTIEPLYVINDQILIADGDKTVDAMNKMPGGYGKVPAPHYLVVTSEVKEGYLENIGYKVEQLILWMTSQGIGTCWIGIYVDVDMIKRVVNFGDSMEYVLMVAFGYPQDRDRLLRDKEYQRKELKDIVEGEVSDITKKLIDAARIAPSAMNSQSWRFAVDGNIIHQYIQQYKVAKLFSNEHIKMMNRIDAGIALAHIKVAAEHFGVNLRLEKIEGKEANDRVYVTSIIMSEP